MMLPIVLCADEESVRRPSLIGLAGENLTRQEWLRLFTSGEDARRFIRNDKSIEEVWVAGSDDIDSINLAATLKQERSGMRVCLVAFEGTGSLISRASAAGIDVSFTRQAFIERYAEMKQGFLTDRNTQSSTLTDYEGNAHAVRKKASLESGQKRPTSRGPAQMYGERHERAAAGWESEQRHSKIAQEERGERTPSAPSATALTQGKEPSVSLQRDGVSKRKDGRAATNNPAFFLPVVSGSGGAGKSTVAALSALFAQGLGYKTLLLDLDLQFGDLRDIMGMPDAPAIDEALRTPSILAQLEAEGLQPALLAAPRHLEDAEAIIHDIPRLLDDVQGRFEVVVVNTGAAWSEEHAALLERSSKAIFLVDQRPSSLRACRHALDLCTRCGIATGPFLFAVNRCAKGALLTSIDVSCALRGASSVELREGGREVEELLGAGQPLDLIAAKNDLCTSLEHVLVDIFPGCEGRTLRVAQSKQGRTDRRFGRGRRRNRKES